MVTVTTLAMLLFFSAAPVQALGGYYSVQDFMTVPLDQAESYVIGAMDGIFLFLDRVYDATLDCPNGLNSTDLMWQVGNTIFAQLPESQWTLYAASPYVINGAFDMGCTIVQQ